ncbi:hypothetical protein MBAV_002216 [Candidatus Magnetobacterium bavaricum]|uniref:Uncharacterized protein n=1 Tax=Candidatus Magnetobacterium bavaricum TaxID=29290 RepID=A0A0F3GUR6_9BACT|nr:hypothetical protein MBAV_002216 [Candidatus Magnetobacterium bavaricum]
MHEKRPDNKGYDAGRTAPKIHLSTTISPLILATSSLILTMSSLRYPLYILW